MARINKTIRLEEVNWEKASRLAKKELRSITKLIEILIIREYEKKKDEI